MNTHLPPPHSLSAAIERLPSVARRKYRALLATADDAALWTRAALEREKQAEESIGDLKRRLSFIDQRTERDRFVEMREEIEALGVELEQLKLERSKRNALRGNCEQVISQLNVAIPALAGQRLRAVTVSANPNAGETLANAILRTRTEIRQAKSDLHELKSSPLTRPEIEAQLREHVSALVNFGTPKLDLRAGQVSVFWPDKSSFSASDAAPGGSASAIFSWLFADKIFEALMSGIDDVVVGGVSAAERIKVGAEIEALIMSLGHTEESLVTTALAAGLEVHRRYDADPMALLGIELINVPVVEQEPESEQITEAAE